ncbi:hypothetical protein ERX37_02515 [Macrococcus hajekii]|uniref:Csa1 family protein n=1 Tax=Macrococcus hajekii TaxID=198482 RepID=A0A4R6BME2_9STAP|nr:hypothetical protein [Macrococcus hajekii]TDM02980.1 hypothetical protein ERX37_02515 [Macrococcus hajekii]GGB05526.1 hypothetical protein GCM10007190_11950 [Macrococcus hajekii]
MLKRLLLLAIPVLFLSGCFYPQNERAENQVAPLDQLNMVQTAVDQYQKENEGLLPIKDRDQSYDIYVKHPVDFDKLQPRYLSELPGSSFEKGGYYQYVLMDVEQNPTVKLVDLRTAEVLKDLRIRLNIQDRTLPLGEKIGPNVYKIAYKKYGLDDYPTVTSPYSGEALPVYVNGGNDLVIDYKQDLGNAIKKKGLKPKEGEDIRPILYQDSPILPAYSVPYTVNEKNEPIFRSNAQHNKN